MTTAYDYWRTDGGQHPADDSTITKTEIQGGKGDGWVDTHDDYDTAIAYLKKHLRDALGADVAFENDGDIWWAVDPDEAGHPLGDIVVYVYQ